MKDSRSVSKGLQLACSLGNIFLEVFFFFFETNNIFSNACSDFKNKKGNFVPVF